MTCRGACQKGKKPELIARIVAYIALGLDKQLVDPDKGVNVDAKVQRLLSAGRLFLDGHVPSVPTEGWLTDFSLLPKVTFPSIYRLFMERSFRAVASTERETITCTKKPGEDIAVGVDVERCHVQ